MADFTNIDGVYAKDTELRSGIDTLRTTVLSNTIKPLTVTKNDTYTAIPSSGTYGYSPIIVDVQEEPWEPLEDGYSNFWFELTNDTLSPWLNFSAKTDSAVIDWGDGSGEQPLDTLTPTHTYSKAGRYVVKVKGVTGIARQQSAPYNSKYIKVLKNVELVGISSFSTYAFIYCTGLENLSIKGTINSIPTSFVQYCVVLENLDFSSCNVKSIGYASIAYDYSINKLVFPSTVTSIDNSACIGCITLSEIHILSTNPPTLGTNVFSGIATDFVIYVPVGYGETYKAALGWSTYADHILEEGQTPNRMMLAKFKEETDEPQDDMR